MLRLSMTFETVSEDSAGNGDTEETGFVFENVPHTARKLAHYLTRAGFTLNRPIRTGVTENRSLHPGRDPQSQKVWAKVLRICGIARD